MLCNKLKNRATLSIKLDKHSSVGKPENYIFLEKCSFWKPGKIMSIRLLDRSSKDYEVNKSRAQSGFKEKV